MIQYKPWSQEVLAFLTKQAKGNGFSCLDIELSGDCPYNCVYCETPYRQQKAIINIPKICSLISSGQFKWIYICGIGEPTYGANQDALLQILSYCKKFDAKCSIFSNLSNLTSEFIEYIKEGILYILFKFDTQNTELLKKIYNLNDLNTHLSNIKTIIDLVECDGNTTNIAASIVPTQENIDEIPHLVDWCIEKNIYPLVAQLEYAGAAKGNYNDLVLNNDQLTELKRNIEASIGEEYRIPFCPSLVDGICITYNNEITIDHRTGLSCHSFWLEDPERDVICDELNDQISIKEITDKLVAARRQRYNMYKQNLPEYSKNIEVFGGCGGNKKDVFRYYIQLMENLQEPYENNLKINRFVYFDNNATTKVSEDVKKEMLQYFEIRFANPSSKTNLGRGIRNDIDNARKIIANVLGCHSESIIFTSSGSEANSLAIHSLLTSRAQKKTIISTEIEHESVLRHLEYLKGQGYSVYNIPICRNGQIDLHAFLENPPNWGDICFASVMYVNNETGVINDIKTLTSILHEHNIPIHCDAVQAFGKMIIDIDELDVDCLSISGHKIHAPKGIGALYIKKSCQFTPLIYGNQEGSRRGGTENVAYIVGLGKATSIAYSNDSFAKNCQRMRELRDEIENKLKEKLCDVTNVEINGESALRVPNTSNIGFEGIDALRLSCLLEARGIYVSNGSACDRGDPKYSHVLKAMNSPSYGNGAIRISLSVETVHRDITYLIDNLVYSIKKIKGGQ